MITIYKHKDNGLSILTEPVAGCWFNVINPTNDEINQLSTLGLPTDYFTYPLDMNERARTERDNGYLFIILRIPYYQGDNADIPYITIPMGIIITDQYLFTVCRMENEILTDFISGRVKNLSTGKRQRFVLLILLKTAARYLAALNEITRGVDALEDQLQLSTRNKEVLGLLKYQKSLTYFSTALRANNLMLDHLQRTKLFVAYPDDEDLLEDVITENQQAIEMTNITSNILSGMMDAFASIISNNLNTVMKFLASVTILVSLPTLIASLYGMNVNLPFMQHPYAFWGIVGTILFASATAGLFFWKKDWF